MTETPAKGTAPLDYYHTFGERETYKEVASGQDFNDLVTKYHKIPVGTLTGYKDREEFLFAEIKVRDQDIAFLQACNRNAMNRLSNTISQLVETRDGLMVTAMDLLRYEEANFWQRLRYLFTRSI